MPASVDAQPGRIEQIAQGAALVGGGALLVAGAVAAFQHVDGASTAALVGAGLALLVVAYLGRYITSIKVKEVEILLDRVQQKAAEALSSLEDVRRSFDPAVLDLPSGGRKDAQRDEQVARAMVAARGTTVTTTQLQDLVTSTDPRKRLELLGILRVTPELWAVEPSVIVTAVRTALGGYDRDRFMALACDALHAMSPEQRDILRAVVQSQRGSAYTPGQIQWQTSDRLLRLIRRMEP